MPTKLGKGGAGQQDYDENNGQYIEGGSIRYYNNKYQVNVNNSWTDISKENYDYLKNKGIKELFDEDDDDAEILKILNNNKLLKSEKLKTLLIDYGSSTKVYNKFAEQKAEEFLKSMPKLKDTSEETVTSGANGAGIRLRKQYCYKDRDTGKLYYKDGLSTEEKLKAAKELKQYAMNCQRCVMAWYLRHLGYDVEALPRKQNGIGERQLKGAVNREIGNWQFSGFLYSGEKIQRLTNVYKSQPYDFIEDYVKRSENDSVFFAQVAWKSGGAHTFIVHNDNGKMKMIDPQVNKIYGPELFDRVKLGSFSMVRVNDLKLNGDILPYIVKGVKFDE